MRRLTGLSGNSRLLLLLRLHSEQLMDISDLSQLKGETAFETINALIAGKDRKICPLADSRMEAVNEVSRRLGRLHRVDKFIYEERGSNDLHVGWPLVHGKFADGTLVRAPLLFFPVSIESDKSDWVLKVRREAGITFNKSFLLAYYYYNQLRADEELLETDFGDFDTDSTVFRTQLYQLLKDRLEINFNPDTFTDKLLPFTAWRKDEFDATHQSGALKLFHEAVLGIFPQAVSQLVPDYLQLINANSEATLEELFSARNQPEDFRHGLDPVATNLAVPEENTYTPFPLDAWQEHALKSVKLGKSLVVQGPPGTGKSQLISNLIADAIASGKRVLLVCQKRVALDVVYDRLRKIDLGDFLGLVHDYRDDRKDVFQKIARQIDRLEEYKRLNRSVDSIKTERRFVQVCRTIDRIVDELEEFRKALYDTGECGLSVKELYLTSSPAHESINIKQQYQHFHFGTLQDFTRKLSRYVRYAGHYEHPEYAWLNRKSFAGLRLSDRKAMEDVVADIPAYQQQLSDQLKSWAGIGLDLERCESLFHRKADADEMVQLLADETTYRFFLHMIDEADEETSLLWVQNMERLVLNCFDGPGMETSLKGEQIGQCQLALQQRMVARRNWYKMVKWELFSEHKFFLKRVLISNDLPYTKYGLRTLEARLDNRLNFEHHLTALRERTWLIDFPGDYNSKSIKRWFEKQRFAVRAKLLFSSLREIRAVITASNYSRDEFIRLIWSVFDAVSPLMDRKKQWEYYLTGYQVRKLINDPEAKDTWIKALHLDFDQLRDYDGLKEELLMHEREVIERLHDHLNTWDEGDFLALFQNSLRLAWIDHIETKYPVLRVVSTLRMEEMETELQQMVEEKQELSREIMLLRARETICESIEYNRLNNRITYRELHHQVTKRKRLWPVRKLIGSFQSEIFKLVPCWMASPESVSAIFPMQEIFDLVIFDEASQCFAERGIPAVARGKQILIAGDSKQLRPFELYQARWEDDSDEMELEVDSLLELCGKYLETSHLQAHYRSKTLELIDFSNTHFYLGHLRVLPDKEVMEKKEPAIEYVKIDGAWHDQTNQPEAEQVVQIVLQQLVGSPEKEIGVVTFNMHQQMLILDLLESEAARSGKSFPSTLIVKNIENVQGDEKDVIIFSIGYAPDKHGKISMQFGSLNVAGGENRLNVAVTRAREKVIVVSSIWPEDLRLQGIKNEGPKLLRAYLEYAREVSSGKYTPRLAGPVKQNPEWYLRTALRRSGEGTSFTWELDRLPFADIVVSREGIPEGIVLTDDRLYYQSFTAKEPHVYTPFLLRQKHWHAYRVFSRNWWTDREKLDHELAKYMYQLEHRN